MMGIDVREVMRAVDAGGGQAVLRTRLLAALADHYISRKRVLHLRTKNPVHAWAAYRIARTLNVAVPAWVLDVFDEWATVLTATTTYKSAKDIADALKIGKGGYETVTKKAIREIRDLEIVADVVHLMQRPTRAELKANLKAVMQAHRVKGEVVDPGDRNISEIMEQVGEKYDLSYSSVTTICYRMIPSLKRLAKRQA